MDTRVPPIASRTHDRCQQQYYQQQQQQQQLHKKSLLLQQEQEKQVTLPPLPAFSAQRHRATKFSLTSNWRNGVTTPKVYNQQDIQRCQPYKVLEIGATPLMHACQQADRVRVLRLLKEQEETIDYRDRALRSAIHYCMDASTGGAVAQAAPELLNDPDAEGHTALHLAVIAGDVQLVAVLLANGADVNAKDLEGHSVLHWATVCGEVECVRLVLAAGARASSADLRGGSPLHYAAQCCGAAATAELAVPKKLGLKVLHTLLEFGADVHACDEDGRQPILWAASAGSVEAVLALVRAGGSTVATASDKDGLTALHCAASRGHARCIEVLVNLCDAQSDHVDNNGCSALHYAATLGHADATSLLLKLGADPNRQDRKGRTPALCAAAKGQLESLKILAQQGASLHARTVRGTGLGHEAVASGRLELLKWLSKRRPSLIHVATQDGKTPLHVAALYGYLDACKLLIDSGARINALMRTSKGILMTVLDAALYRAHRDCAKFIQLHGGMTAQHLKLHKVVPSKLHAKHVETSSDSEFNGIRSRHRHRQYHHRDPEVYYEERWVERRIRRRANRRRQFRQNSRSFSEEQLHLSKSSSTARATNRQRRALSENARYESSDSDLKKKHNNSEGRGRRKKNEIHARRKNNQANKSGSESIESEDPSRSFKSGEESSSVSDDSLEVIVVKKLLESKSEKIISGKKFKTICEKSKNIKDYSKSNKSNKKKVIINEYDKLKVDKLLKKEILKRNILNHEQAFINTDGDTSNKDTVEQITISADIHLNKGLNMSTEKNLDVVKRMNIEQEPDQHAKNKMDNILGKADEIQNALLAKAADLKKGMEEMRYCIFHSSEGIEYNKNIDKEKNDEKYKDIENENEPVSKDFPFIKKDSYTIEKYDGQNKKVHDKQLVGLEDDENLEFFEKNKKSCPILETLDQTKIKVQKTHEEVNDNNLEKDLKEMSQHAKKESTTQEVLELKRKSSVKEIDLKEIKQNVEIIDALSLSHEDKKEIVQTLEEMSINQIKSTIPDGTSSSSPTSEKNQISRYLLRPSTEKRRTKVVSNAKLEVLESSEECSPDRSAIIAVIESPEWDEENDEELDKEIRKVIGNMKEHYEDEIEDNDSRSGDNELGIVRVLSSVNEKEMNNRASIADSLPQLQPKLHERLYHLSSSHQQQHDVENEQICQRHDSGGRDSGIEPSPRISMIPKRTLRCYPNSKRQQALHMDTITRDVQISMRRYHLERKIFFQLMELKRLQIRHGRTNEHVLVKRQVDAFHKAGMNGPLLGVTRYDHQPFTFSFENYKSDPLHQIGAPMQNNVSKKLTAVIMQQAPIPQSPYIHTIIIAVGGIIPERMNLLPKIESHGKGRMTVEVTHGEEKKVISLPSETLDRAKRYYVTFTVRGETTDGDKTKTPPNSTMQRNTNSI